MCRFSALVFVTLLMVCSGCATFVTGAGPDQKIRVRSEPNGARVFVDGDYRGITPTSISVTRVDQHLVRVELNGFAPYDRELKPSFNPWFLGNIPLTLVGIIPGPVGAIIDLLDGAVSWVGGDVTARLTPAPGTVYGTPPQPSGYQPTGGYRSDGAAAPRSIAPSTPRAAPHPPQTASDTTRLPQRRRTGAN
jgi:hypothetical protein